MGFMEFEVGRRRFKMKMKIMNEEVGSYGYMVKPTKPSFNSFLKYTIHPNLILLITQNPNTQTLSRLYSMIRKRHSERNEMGFKG